MNIRLLKYDEQPPIDLLLLADPSLDMIENYISTGECYIAELDKQTIGVYVILPINEDVVELVNVAVSEQYQGKGIGKLLVLHAIQSAQRKGYKSIEVGTGNSSIGQLALYQKCGFRIIGIDKDYFIKHYEDEIFENGIQCKDMVRLALDLLNYV